MRAMSPSAAATQMFLWSAMSNAIAIALQVRRYLAKMEKLL